MKKLAPYIDDFLYFFVANILIKMLVFGEKLSLGLLFEVSLAAAGFSWFFNWILYKVNRRN
jgi:hypothetical protein